MVVETDLPYNSGSFFVKYAIDDVMRHKLGTMDGCNL
jgi:hypothetical protein